MDAPESPPALLPVIVSLLTDPGALVVLLATVFGFMLPMLLVYPPVSPRPSDFLSETHSKLGLGWNRIGAKPRELSKAGYAAGVKHGDGDSDGEMPGGAKSSASPSSSLLSSPEKAGSGPPRVDSLWVYPIKSCPGIQVPRSRVLPTGLEFDRMFTFAQLKTPFPARAGVAVGEKQIKETEDEADEESWEFITQRQFPLLASLEVELWRPDLAKVRRAQARMRSSDRAERTSSMGESYVVVRYPWREAGWAGRWAWAAAKLARGWRAVPEVEVVLPITLPADEKARAAASYGRVRVWRDVVRALDLSAEVPRSLQLYLGVSNRLGVLRVDPDHLRQIFRCAPRKDEAGYQPVTGFQDAYPVHLLNRNSVRALESVVQTDKDLPELDERRFRANIVVDGIEAYDEDAWKLVSFKPPPKSPSLLDEAKFYVCCRTVRCKLPNVNPDTGERHKREPDFALRKYREVDEGAPKMGCLGMQLTPMFEHLEQPELMELTLEAGMAVNVLQRGEHLYVKI